MSNSGDYEILYCKYEQSSKGSDMFACVMKAAWNVNSEECMLASKLTAHVTPG